MLFAALIATLSALSSPANADDAPKSTGSVKCGGTYAGEDLIFKVNPLNGVQSAYSANEEITVFVDLSRPAMPHLIFAEVVKDEEWEKLRALRDASSDKDFQELLSRLGSTKVTELWVGWTGENYLHIDSKQRNKQFSLSCQKL